MAPLLSLAGYFSVDITFWKARGAFSQKTKPAEASKALFRLWMSLVFIIIHVDIMRY